MSLKPKKKSDLKKIEEKMKVKASKMASMQHLPPYTMIVSEGIKTEPIYIKGLVNKVNENIRMKPGIRISQSMEPDEIPRD